MIALLLALGLHKAEAETCLSPFVKRLDRPEKYLYVFCVDADAKDHDFLAVIDVDRKSPSYGTILHQLDLGSSGNETHHFGYTDDRTHIWGCSLFSSRIFLIDVATDPAKPRLAKSARGPTRENWPVRAAFAVRASRADAPEFPRRQRRWPAGGVGGVQQRR
jgi:selenium-binding protein 1